MSHGMKAGLEIRGTQDMPPATWLAVVPSVDVDEVPNRTLFTMLAGYDLPWLGLKALLPVRGLPHNVTRPINDLYDAWGGTAYDASWVKYEELVVAVQHLTVTIEALAHREHIDAYSLLRLHRGVSIDAVIAFMGIYHGRGFEARLVFWFTPV